MDEPEYFEGKRGPGRPPGTPNKVTAAAKAVIAEAATELGGVKRLVEWARLEPKNEAAFWTSIYPRLLPHDVNHGIQPGDALAQILANVDGRTRIVQPAGDASPLRLVR